jgi:hypothetical protein
MTMHLEGPWLSTTGKRRGKVKFRNAEEAKKARELEESWKALQKKWEVEAEDKKKKRAMAAPVWNSQSMGYQRETTRIPSLNGGVDSTAATLKPRPVYTGTKIKGIGTMHKSNAVPIFSDEEAIEISRMRR